MKSTRLPFHAYLFTAVLFLAIQSRAVVLPARCDPRLSAIELKGKTLSSGLNQLTGTDQVAKRLPDYHELADPAPPFYNKDGSVDIYGSAPYVLHYANISEFEHGGTYHMKCMALHYPNGQTSEDPNLIPWDTRRYHVREGADKFRDVLIAGSMTASQADGLPSWPTDNPTRRIFFYRFMQLGHWLRDVEPIFGSVSTGWTGHSYGGNLFQDNTPRFKSARHRVEGRNLFLS